VNSDRDAGLPRAVRHKWLLGFVLAGLQALPSAAVYETRPSSLRPHNIRLGCRGHLLYADSAEIHEEKRSRQLAGSDMLDARLHHAVYPDWASQDTVGIFEKCAQAIKDMTMCQYESK
jgi:hypothetical protein